MTHSDSIIETIWRDLDGELTPKERTDLETALLGDPAIRAAWESRRHFDQTLRATTRQAPRDDDTLAERLIQILDRDIATRPRRARWRIAAPLAIAAGLMLALGITSVWRPPIHWKTTTSDSSIYRSREAPSQPLAVSTKDVQRAINEAYRHAYSDGIMPWIPRAAGRWRASVTPTRHPGILVVVEVEHADQLTLRWERIFDDEPAFHAGLASWADHVVAEAGKAR